MVNKGQKKGRGRQQGNQGFLTEASRVRIGKILEDFRASDEQVYTFEPDLAKEERAAIHAMCRKMGMTSKSSGKGVNRCLSLIKNKKKHNDTKKDESVTSLRFSEESKTVLQALFMHYPPDTGEVSEDVLRNCQKVADNANRKQDTCFFRPSICKDEIKKKMGMLALSINENPKLRKTAEDRAKLPIASYKNAITSSLETHQVVLIAGETGCGKTTQVPQYILDHMWTKAEACKVVCTQPRRISAISVAERISYERGDTVGDTVGYKIRFESKGGKNSSIMFCTNGVLLRVLIDRGSNASEKAKKKRIAKDILLEITHIIVDEIHERDRYSDMLLPIIRDLLPAYPHLRLILMSATIDAERFSRYFSGCPIIQVPGLTYPVKTYYLEDVLSILRSDDHNHLATASLNSVEEVSSLSQEYKTALNESINLALCSDELEPLLELISAENQKIYNYQHSMTGVSPLMVLAAKGRVGDVCKMLSFGADYSLTDNNGRSALDWARQENQLHVCEIIKKHMDKDMSKSVLEGDLLNNYLASINPELIDIVLIERLLKKISADSSEGAILIFLPGWDDIHQTRERLLASEPFRDSSKFMIHSLHSMIPILEQKKVFKHPPKGVRKIVLSTNIAETAVTIDDVVYVIDSGRMKEKSYDPYSNVSTLHASWISKASARQREGRAGRCQPGICYHLYSKIRAASMLDYQVPEIKRMPIEELCLQVKLLDPDCRVAEFLQKTLDPPVFETVRNAMIVLQDIGALTEDEQLTELGKKLGALPVHPSTSKMLLFAILMNCLDPALTLACAADYREPFILPATPDEKKKAAAAKVELASLYGGYSDQLAVVAAFECWKRAKFTGQEFQFCSRYYVSSTTMNMLMHMRQRLLTELVNVCFIPEDMSNCSINAQDPGILRAVLMAGSYPMVARLLPRVKKNRNAIVETVSGSKVCLHPHSSIFKLWFKKSAGCPIIVFDEITRGDGGLHVRNSSVVSPFSLVLLAVEMAVSPAADNEDSDEDSKASGAEVDAMDVNTPSEQHENQIMSYPDNVVTIVVDRWLTFQSTALDVAQIYCLRERLAEAMLFKVKNPAAVLPPALSASAHAIACILSNHGLPHILLEEESLDPQAPNQQPLKLGRMDGLIPPSDFLRSLMSNNGAQFSQSSQNSRGRGSAPPPRPANFHGPSPGMASQHHNPKRPSFKRRRGSAGGAPRW